MVAVPKPIGLMLGIRQPLDGAVFRTLQEAEDYCVSIMTDHFDRRLGMSDARIHPFKGLVDCGPPSDPALLRDIQRICEQVAKERACGSISSPSETPTS